MGTFTGDILRLLAAGAIQAGTQTLGNLVSIPMHERAAGRATLAKGLIEGLGGLPEEAMPAAAKKLVELLGPKAALPTYQAPTGNVIGPSGESLAMTPRAGAPVTAEMKERFLRPAPSREQLMATTLNSMPRNTLEQVAIGSIAPKLVPSYEDIQRYGPEGIERQRTALMGQEVAQNEKKIGIAQRQADIAEKESNARFGIGGLEWAKVATENAKVKIAQGQLDAHLNQINNDYLKYVDTRDYHSALLKLEEKKLTLDEATKTATTAIAKAKLIDDYVKSAKELDALMTDKKHREMPGAAKQAYTNMRNSLLDTADLLMGKQPGTSRGGKTTTPSPFPDKKTVDPRIEALRKAALAGYAAAQQYLDKEGIKWQP